MATDIQLITQVTKRLIQSASDSTAAPAKPLWEWVGGGLTLALAGGWGWFWRRRGSSPSQPPEADNDCQREPAAEAQTEIPEGSGRKLPESGSLIQALLDSANAMLFACDLEGRFLLANLWFQRVLGVSGREVVGQPLEGVLPTAMAAKFRQALPRIMEAGEPERAEESIALPDGPHTFAAVLFPLKDDQGRVYALGGLAVDITGRKRMEVRLQESRQLHRSLFRYNSDMVAYFDRKGFLTAVNPAVERKLGFRPGQLRGHHFRDLLPSELAEQVGERLRRVFRGGTETLEAYIRNRKGHPFWLHATMGPTMVNGEITGVWVIAKDNTQQRRREDQLANLAYRDPLTGLPNRTMYIQRLEALLQKADQDSRLAVLFIDLDRFKRVNDTLGHQAGDKVLMEAAHRLQGSVDAGDMVARLAGDEFTALLAQPASPAAAVAVAGRMVEALSQPFQTEGQEVFITPSIGVVMGTPGDTAWELVRHADQAMYHAKRRGGARCELYRQDLPAMTTDLTLESDLRRAIARHEFRLFYQPVISLQSGNVEGMEALIRWDHPHRGLVLPAAFIREAEETGLIIPIGLWVLEEACRQFQRWQEQPKGKTLRYMSVNLSARQFDSPTLVEDIAAILERTGMPGSALELEITESVLLPDDPGVEKVLERLRAMGISLAVDDFGTVYSSLSYVQRMPLRLLKIDRSFVRGLGSELTSTAIVRALVTFAQTLNLKVTGEGVETPGQMEELLAMGCDQGQGFYFAHPMPAEEAASFLSFRHPLPGAG